MKRNVTVLFIFLSIFLLVGCQEKNLRYEGATDNWEVVYKIKGSQDKISRQDVDIRFIGENSSGELSYSLKTPNGGGCEMYNLTLDEKGEMNLSGCLQEPRPDYEDDSFKVTITLGEEVEIIELKRVN